MSAEQVQAFLKMAGDVNFRQGFEMAATPEAKRQFLAAANLDITVEDAMTALAEEGELTDEELERAAGADIGVIRFPTNP